jgi:NADPH-dependent F420 reductase
MNVAILGGTGEIGAGLAKRWGRQTDHAITVGSRSAERAEAAVGEYRDSVPEGNYAGAANVDATRSADVVVLAVPPYHVESTIDDVREALERGAIVLTPAVGIRRCETGFEYHPPPAGSVTELVADAVPARVHVVGCLHNVPAEPLADLDLTLDLDTPLVADDEGAADTVRSLVGAIPGVDTICAGPVANASEVESLVPLLLNMERHGTRADDLSIRLTPAQK